MAKVTFESSDGKRSLTVEANGRVALADLCDDHEAPIPFSCRSASCGTCHVEILQGEDALEAPSDEELDVLDAIGSAAPRFRLACQAKTKDTNQAIHVKAQNEY